MFTVLSGLKSHPHNLQAVVSMADDGGSTGVLREEFGILPPGDIRRALVALSESEKFLSDLFNYRFSEGSFEGHNFGNLFIAALERLTGDFERAVEEAAQAVGDTPEKDKVESEPVSKPTPRGGAGAGPSDPSPSRLLGTPGRLRSRPLHGARRRAAGAHRLHALRRRAEDLRRRPTGDDGDDGGSRHPSAACPVRLVGRSGAAAAAPGDAAPGGQADGHRRAAAGRPETRLRRPASKGRIEPATAREIGNRMPRSCRILLTGS